MTAQATVRTPGAPRPRLLYLDNLRTLLIILVILTHLAITYGAEGSWYYNEEGSTTLAGAVLMTLTNAINQSLWLAPLSRPRMGGNKVRDNSHHAK